METRALFRFDFFGVDKNPNILIYKVSVSVADAECQFKIHCDSDGHIVSDLLKTVTYFYSRSFDFNNFDYQRLFNFITSFKVIFLEAFLSSVESIFNISLYIDMPNFKILDYNFNSPVLSHVAEIGNEHVIYFSCNDIESGLINAHYFWVKRSLHLGGNVFEFYPKYMTYRLFNHSDVQRFVISYAHTYSDILDDSCVVLDVSSDSKSLFNYDFDRVNYVNKRLSF